MANRKNTELAEKIITYRDAGWTQYKISQHLKIQPSLVAYYWKKYGTHKSLENRTGSAKVQ